MALSLPALFTLFIVTRLFAVASADPNSHKDAGGWRMASVISQFGADRNRCTDVCYFMHKNTRQKIKIIFWLIKNKSLQYLIYILF